MFGFRMGKGGAVGNLTQIQRAIAFLRSLGSDAHVWLPGVGSVNGLYANNYILSDGSTGLAPVDQYVGRVNDAMGTLGPELVDSANSASAWAAYGTNTVAQDGDAVKVTFSSTSGGAYLYLSQAGGLNSNLVLNNTYTISVQLKINFGSANFAIYNTSLGAYIDSTAISSADYVTRSFIFSHVGGVPYIQFANIGSGEIVWIRNISVREVTGIQAIQATTANKPQLKLVGSSYRWVFDSTDLLAATLPAGWEAATTIDAKSTSQVTLQNQNIVGAYSVGPSLTTSGRIVLRTSPTAEKLALLQNFANKLAGL